MTKDLTKCDWVVTIDDLEDDNSEIFKLSDMNTEEVKAKLTDKAHRIAEDMKYIYDGSLLEVKRYKGNNEMIVVAIELDSIDIADLVAQPYIWLPELK